MDPKQQAINSKQKERHDRGEDFEREVRASWRHIPQIWTIDIADGRGGSRPGDRLTIAPKVNLLTELKRTAKKEFQLAFLRANQIRGLVDFDQVIDRNYGLVLVSFHDLAKGIDEAYAIRLTAALRYMQRHDKAHIKLEELRQASNIAIPMPRLNTAEPAFDMKGVVECYRYF